MGDDQLRPTLPPDTPDALTAIAAACFDPEPQNRPSFALIVHHMRKVGASNPKNPNALKNLNVVLRLLRPEAPKTAPPSRSSCITCARWALESQTLKP